MRIAFFSDNFYPELSGITDTIITTGLELKKRGHEIVYIAPSYAVKDYRTARRDPPKTKEEDTIGGIPIVRLPALPILSPTKQSRFVSPFCSSSYYQTGFVPDVIHTQSPYGLGWLAVRAARHFRVPLIGTNHTAIEDFFPFPSIMRSFDAWYYNHCDFVTAPYEGLLTRMREKGFRKPGRAVANPAELAAFSPATPEEKQAARKDFNLTGPVVLYAGRLGVEKRVDVIVRAMPALVRQFPTITLLLTGHGSAEGKLKALVRKLSLEEHVRFTGFLPRASLPQPYKAADVFAMMSTSDSQSIALMQAYASGMPAVCARARGLPDYTPPDCGFLVEPGNSSLLAEKLSLLLSDSEKRSTMGSAAHAYAQRFSPERIADEWESIYQDALTSFHSRTR